MLENPYMRHRNILKDKVENKTIKIAIILVPAIGASNIYKDGQKNVSYGWAPDNERLMTTEYVKKSAAAVADNFRKNALAWEPEEPNNKDEKVGWNQVHSGTYGKFLKECKGKKFSFKTLVCAIGYNFFRSNLQSAERIIQRTEQILEESKADGFIYITHSMGALPVRAALKLEKDKKEQEQDYKSRILQNCLGVIHVVAPNLGAPEAYMRFHRGVKKGGLGELFVLGRTGFDFAVKACFIPSMCEILPVRNYANHTIESAVNNQGKSGISALSVPLETIVRNVLQRKSINFSGFNLNVPNCLWSLRQNLQSAKDFHEFLGNYMFDRTKLIVISGIPTVMKVKGDLNTAINEKGDGTVPLDSQKAGHVGDENIVEIKQNNKELTHGDPFKKAGKKKGVFDHIYALLEDLYQTGLKNNFFGIYDESLALSSVLGGLEVDKQPIFLNGQKSLFDKAVTTTPVTIEPKPTPRQLYINKKSY